MEVAEFMLNFKESIDINHYVLRNISYECFVDSTNLLPNIKVRKLVLQMTNEGCALIKSANPLHISFENVLYSKCHIIQMKNLDDNLSMIVVLQTQSDVRELHNG